MVWVILVVKGYKGKFPCCFPLAGTAVIPKRLQEFRKRGCLSVANRCVHPPWAGAAQTQHLWHTERPARPSCFNTPRNSELSHSADKQQHLPISVW